MAEQIISPGVFTRENDQSFLPAGIGAIGAAVVGPTLKGPAFVPTVLNNFADYVNVFGPMTDDTFVPHTVANYLRSAGTVTVCRVLAGGGYTYDVSGNQQPVAIISQTHATAHDALDLTGAAGTDLSFTITLTVADGGESDSQGTIILLDTDQTTAPAAAANTIAVGTSGTADAVITANTIDAINGVVNAVNTKVKQATSGVGQTGIIGIEAFPGTTDTEISLRLKLAGGGGNTGTVIATTSGVNVTSGNPVAFTGGKDVILGIIKPSKALSPSDLSLSAVESGSNGSQAIATGSFGVLLKGVTGGSQATSGQRYTASLNPINQDYLFTQINDNSANSKTAVDAYDGTPGFAYMNFEAVQKQMVASGSMTGNTLGNYQIGSGSQINLFPLSSDLVYSGNELAQTEGYSYASTPYFRSQFIDASKNTKQLFRIHTLAHGSSCNKDYKISIANHQTPADIDGIPQYATFSLILRRYNDKDSSMSSVGAWNNLSLDPESTNYIAKVIGDQYPQYNDVLDKVELLGNYPTSQPYIRVEVDSAVEDKATSPSLLPKGFAAIKDPILASAFTLNSIVPLFPSASYEGSQQVGGVYDSNGFLGWMPTEKENGKHNENWLLPLTDAAIANVSGEFNIDNYFGHNDSGLWSGSLSASIDSTGNAGPTNTQLQFTAPFQNGDDGIRPDTVRFTGGESTLSSNYTSNKIYGFDLSSATTAGTVGYGKALNILSNQDEYDINMLVTPGLNKRYHSTVTTKAITTVEGRGDCFYIMDVVDKDASIGTAISNISGTDSNYAATYYPWVKVDGATRPILVPPSVVVPGAIAQSDAIAGGAEWFAPAGLNRGVLGRVRDVKIRLNQSERDRLYEAKINPIASFPGLSNPCIWGQKTLQSRATALNRINVRRLLIAVKKYIASSSRYLVFEQNTSSTRNRFLNIVNPYLEGIQQGQGLYAFRVVMDESNNTPDVVDRNQLVGNIYLQPAKTAEFIVLDFNVLPTGATFDTGGGGGY
tara:strand:+ start:2899 stop:5895 length:2997 start_codon:yes stop_codon:yes gene_type:complete